MLPIKEASYVFKHRDKEYTIHCYVDLVENRRHFNNLDLPVLSNPLNYKGTGNAYETFELVPLVIYNEVPNRYRGFDQEVVFYLPDVDAYAIGYFSEMEEGYERYSTFSVKLLNKLCKCQSCFSNNCCQSE